MGPWAKSATSPSPRRAAGLDLRRGEPFVIPVIPLAEIGVDQGVRVAGETAGFAGAPQRGDHDESELARLQVAAQVATQCRGLIAALGGEGNIGEAGVGARPAPLGFAMADQPEFAHLSCLYATQLKPHAWSQS